MRYGPAHRWLRIDEGDLMDGTRDMTPRALPGVLAWLVMAVIALGIAGYAVYRPAGNADLIEYIAVVRQWEGATGADLNAETYADLDELLDDAQFADVTGSQGITELGRDAYLAKIKADPEALRQQLPFYSVKPLYPALMAALGVAGVPLGFGSVLDLGCGLRRVDPAALPLGEPPRLGVVRRGPRDPDRARRAVLGPRPALHAGRARAPHRDERALRPAGVAAAGPRPGDPAGRGPRSPERGRRGAGDRRRRGAGETGGRDPPRRGRELSWPRWPAWRCTSA